MNKSDAVKIASENNIPKHCIWCGKDCAITEIVDTGEAWERWCYCPDCEEESFHLIKEY